MRRCCLVGRGDGKGEEADEVDCYETPARGESFARHGCQADADAGGGTGEDVEEGGQVPELDEGRLAGVMKKCERIA